VSLLSTRISERGDVMKIVVIGGTGLIGFKVVANLRQKGHEAFAAAPNTGVNTITGEGLREALAGAQVVIDLANSPSFTPFGSHVSVKSCAKQDQNQKDDNHKT
jgi:hypothetical protein